MLYLLHLLLLQLCAMNHTGELMELKNNSFFLLWEFSFESVLVLPLWNYACTREDMALTGLGNLGFYKQQ